MKSSIIFLEPDKPVDNEYSERFRQASTAELIETFNGDIGKTGWVNARGRFHGALAYEFSKRGLSMLNDAKLSLDHKVRLSDDGLSLEKIENPDAP